MKKFKIIFMVIILLSLTGCFKDDSMEDISIVTSVYPIEYVVNSLYGEHSTVTSIYPKDSDITDFEITEILLEQYSDNDLFIFNGLSNEKKHVENMLKNNKNLKIIDITSNMKIDYSIEELWLDPNNLLTISNNIRNGFNEYIKSTYLTNEVNENYENLKIDLTNLDGKYYSVIKNSPQEKNVIIVSDDAFKYLQKYGIEVISLDPDTVTQKDSATATELIQSGSCIYVYTKYNEDTEQINDFISDTGAEKLELYTMTNLYDTKIDKNSYITLMNQNLENIKMELYK